LAVCLSAANTHDSMLLVAVVGAVPPINGQRDCPADPASAPPSCTWTSLRLSTLPASTAPTVHHARIARRGVETSQRLGRRSYTAERPPTWLVGDRRLQVRYERRADVLPGFLLACALIYLKSSSS
jgi:hypothetical protein